MLAAIAAVVLTTLFLVREDRASLIARHFTESRLSQIEALRDALKELPDPPSGAPPHAGWGRLQRLAREFGFILVPAERRPEIGVAPRGRTMEKLRTRLAERLGGETEVRLGMRFGQPVVWLRLPAGPSAQRTVWAGIPVRAVETGELPRTLLTALAVALAVVLALTWWFTRRLTRPLEELSAAMTQVARGGYPAPLPESGPKEIAAVASNVNRMTAALARLESNRSTMLAGISHDLRTPLTRLRLATEMSVDNEKERRAMVADLDAIERVLTQFLDFARGAPQGEPEVHDLQTAVAAVVERVNAEVAPTVGFTPGPEALPVALHPTAFERMLVNLIDNARHHGAPPVAIELRRDGMRALLDVLDRGNGIDPARTESLRQPFVRGDEARSDAPGAGLGLAIVERLAEWHGAVFELLPRSGGGTVARLAFPLAAALRKDRAP